MGCVLNSVYTRQIKKLSANIKASLKASQIQWIKYRDLEFGFIDQIHHSIEDGTLHNVLFAKKRMEFVKKRVLEHETYFEILEEEQE